MTAGRRVDVREAVVAEQRSLRHLLGEVYTTHGRDPMSPGFHVLALHRLKERSRQLPAPLSSAVRTVLVLLSLVLRNLYGIELPSKVPVGRRVKIGHQGGIVIHGNCVIGDDCVIRQNVTIGLSGRPDDPAAPVLGRGVEVGAGAVIIGGITVGDGARIGPNAVVTTDVPRGATVKAPPSAMRLAS